jgi:hypothetical protein
VRVGPRTLFSAIDILDERKLTVLPMHMRLHLVGILNPSLPHMAGQVYARPDINRITFFETWPATDLHNPSSLVSLLCFCIGERLFFDGGPSHKQTIREKR